MRTRINSLNGLILSMLAVTFFTLSAQADSFYRGDPNEKVTLKMQLERAAIRFFQENSHPESGLVRASANNFKRSNQHNRKASISATGFAIAALANAGQREIVNPAYARSYVLKTLKFAKSHLPRWKGWFSEEVDWESGERWNKSEFSTTSTALFLAGALYAARIYPETEIAEIAYDLYNATDFYEFLTDGGSKPKKKTLSTSYDPERGFSEKQWSADIESSLLMFLGIGHALNPLPAEVWLQWERKVTTVPSGEKVIGADQGLFAHQYSQVFIDFQGFNDAYNIDYFENGRLATNYNRSTCLNNSNYKSFREGFWGLDPSIAPSEESKSTVCIGCAMGSAMYSPTMILSDARKWLDGPHSKNIWGRYGFIDSLDLDRNWYSSDVRGVTLGSVYLSLANTDASTSIWRHFREIPEIKTAMAKAEAVTQR